MGERAIIHLRRNTKPNDPVDFQSGGTELQKEAVRYILENRHARIGEVAHEAGIKARGQSATIDYIRDVLKAADDEFIEKVTDSAGDHRAEAVRAAD